MDEHTHGEIVGAFTAAAAILRDLKKLGLEQAHFELFSDASGVLFICDATHPEAMSLANKHYNQIVSMIYSNRVMKRGDWVGIRFCEGLFQYAAGNPRPL